MQQQVQLKVVQEGDTIIPDEILDSLAAEDGELMHISVHALAGTEQPKTLRLKAQLKNQHMLILLDSGSSHNFLDKSLAAKLQCHSMGVLPTKVKVANGDIFLCSEAVPAFQWLTEGHTF